MQIKQNNGADNKGTLIFDLRNKEENNCDLI